MLSRFAKFALVFIFLALGLSTILPIQAHCPKSLSIDKKYLWPLKTDKESVTGTLGEFRYSAFHGGIDLSTQGSKIPVLAIDKGRLKRLMFGRYNIGFAIWLDHPDGSTSKYGHLSSFASRILQRLPKKIRQRILLRKDFNYYPDFKLEIDKGETIAISGDSGLGPYHLHLEVWKNGTRINILNNGLSYPDSIAPWIQSMELIPLDPHSRINGKFENKKIMLISEKLDEYQKDEKKYIQLVKKSHKTKLKKKEEAWLNSFKRRTLKILRFKPLNGEDAENIRLSGRIGIKISAYDRAIGFARLGLASADLLVNRKKIFTLDFCQMPPQRILNHAYIYDRNETGFRGGALYTYFLFKRNGKNDNDSLAFIHGHGDGILEANPHRYSSLRTNILLYDANRNLSTVKMYFKVDSKIYDPVILPQANVSYERGGRVVSENGKFLLDFPANAVPAPQKFVVTQERKRLRLPRGLIQKSSLYFVSPQTKDFIKLFKVSIKAKKYAKTAIYRVPLHEEDFDKKDLWRQKIVPYRISSKYSKGTFFGHQSGTGIYVLIADRRSPYWARSSVRNRGKYKQKNLQIFLRPRDLGSGVNTSTLRVYIDGRRVYTDHDPDRHRIEIFYPPRIKKPGWHRLVATVQDFAGNQSRPLRIRYYVQR